MADSTSGDSTSRPRAIGGGVAVADDGDVAFGAMAGAGVLAAILVSFFVIIGTIGSGVESPVGHGGTATPTTAADADAFAISAALAAAGFPPVQLSSVANTVTVRGSVPDEATREAILDFIIDQPNVTEVVDEMVITQPPSTEAMANIDATPDGIFLTGSVPSEQIATALRELASANFEPEAITDELVVLDGATEFTVSSSGFFQDPAKYKSFNEGLIAALGEYATDGRYTPGIRLDAAVDDSLNELVQLEPILFQTGTAVIDAASLPTIDAAAEILKTFPAAPIEIGGHTDNTGDAAFNAFLSLKRAEAVKAALEERGVENELVAVGYGPDQPVGDNGTEAGRAANRRIQFTAL